jgi:hypothetical protein
MQFVRSVWSSSGWDGVNIARGDRRHPAARAVTPPRPIRGVTFIGQAVPASSAVLASHEDDEWTIYARLSQPARLDSEDEGEVRAIRQDGSVFTGRVSLQWI